MLCHLLLLDRRGPSKQQQIGPQHGQQRGECSAKQHRARQASVEIAKPKEVGRHSQQAQNDAADARPMCSGNRAYADDEPAEAESHVGERPNILKHLLNGAPRQCGQQVGREPADVHETNHRHHAANQREKQAAARRARDWWGLMHRFRIVVDARPVDDAR
jgi:hypothetical protein